MINPRGPEFAILLEECLAGVRWGLQTHSRILLFGASGTGGLEAAVANLLSPGERAVFCTNGWFGEMWASMAEAYGVDVVRVRAPWGEPVDSDRLERVLESEPAVGKVFLTHCETSTGVLNDVLELSTVARRYGCLVAVDSVSGVPCHPLPVDELGLDIVITASQKGWLAPPGLTMVAVSDAAMRAAAQARCPRWYLDFRRQASAQDKGTLPSTPPLSVMFALAEGLAILREEGLQTIWNRHARVGSLARRGLRQLGLELICAGRSPSNTVSVVRSPCANPNELPDAARGPAPSRRAHPGRRLGRIGGADVPHRTPRLGARLGHRCGAVRAASSTRAPPSAGGGPRYSHRAAPGATSNYAHRCVRAPPQARLVCRSPGVGTDRH